LTRPGPTTSTATVTEFEKIYARHFLNYGLISDRYTSIPEVGSMLVITHDAFHAAAQPYVDWKNQMGIPTALVDVSAVGSTGTQIKDYIQNLYDTEGVCFIVLVGDAAQVPYFNNGGASDPSYALLAGGDMYPDAFVGRLSAENISQVQTQVERSIEYERDPQGGADWYHKGTGIASNQGPGDDGETDNEHMDVIREKLLAFTYTEVDQIYDPYGTAADVTNALNEGRSIINYCGHGWIQGWGSTGFSNTEVNALVNDNMLPFITSVACNTGEFQSGTCFGEAWLRATNGGEPTGGVGFYGSTISQSWSPPMCAQDEFVDLLVNEEKRCYGALCFNGACQMIDEYGANGENEFKFWTVFGDPSLRVRTDTPAAISADHFPTVDPLMDHFTVSTEPGNLAALSSEGAFIGAAFADAGGEAVIYFEGDLPMPGNFVTLTVTGFNRLTHVAEILVGDGLLPTCEVDPASFNVLMEPDQIQTDWLHISNYGEEGSTLYYSIELSDPGYPRGWNGIAHRNMTGSTAWTEPDGVYPGSTVDMDVFVFNGSTDNEWVKRFTMDLPPGVALNSAGPLTGGGGGDIPYVGGYGDGAFADWALGEGWGNIYPDETGQAAINLSFTGMAGDVVIPYVIYGDIWGDAPHEVAGEIVIHTLGPNVTVLAPNGGEFCAVGSELAIEFAGGGGPENVRIELSRDGGFGGRDWEVLAESVPLGIGSFTWTVTGPISANCLVKVTDVDDITVTDFSDGPFTIFRELTWVSLSSYQGSVPQGETESIQVTFDSFGLPDDTYLADITISSNAGDPVLVPVTIEVLTDPTGAESAPLALALAQNHPNPFNPKTTIRFALPAAGPVELAVYDATGRRVRTLLSGPQPAGTHHVVWEGKDDGGHPLASGVYLYRLETEERVLSRKMLLLK